tara:strand:- start:930 stop:1271 length:342 start_codon:yes stop_codon:yes gene_type:complete
MGYPHRGNLPGSKTDKLTYELIRSHLNSLHRSICKLATCEHLLRSARYDGDASDREHQVEIWLSGLNEKLDDILPDISADTSALDEALDRLIMSEGEAAIGRSVINKEENNDG